jgi:hypothetical protein
MRPQASDGNLLLKPIRSPLDGHSCETSAPRTDDPIPIRFEQADLPLCVIYFTGAAMAASTGAIERAAS